jgi:hypothetical protein
MDEILLDKLSKSRIPEHMRHSLVYYLTEGRPVGHFLTAVLSNDLKEACNRADDLNRHLLYDYIFFLFNNAPGNSWGSPERVHGWLKLHQERREKLHGV